MGDNNNADITLKISDAVNGQRTVHVSGDSSHHDAVSHQVAEDELTRLLAETRQNRWRTEQEAGVALGVKLYDLFNRNTNTLQRLIDKAMKTGGHTNLYIQTPYDLTQLPFELLNNGGFVLINHNMHVIRLVEQRNELNPVERKKEPLRMLFMACSPTDEGLDVLDFEKEEERIFDNTSKYNIDMQVEDTGSLEGLKQVNNSSGGFDIIHITGHAGMDEEMGPVFCMEDEVGNLKKVSPEGLWDAIEQFPPKILFLSGCSTGEEASSESFAYRMAHKGVRWVLGWGLSVSDYGAMVVAGKIYESLSVGNGIDYAVQSARRLTESKYHPWPLLRLFGDRSPIMPLVEAGQPLRHVNPVKMRHKVLKDSNVRVLESGFVGRRRNVQRGVKVLRGADDKFGLLVRGSAGIGKSCLIGKLVERFTDKVLVVFHGVVSEKDVILKLMKLFDKLDNKDGLVILKSDSVYEEKIKALFRKVFKSQIPTIIYFDDFERNLDRRGNQHHVKNAVKGIISPFLEAIDWAEGKSNVVITSRYNFILEHEVENLLATSLYDLTLRSFDGADLSKKKRELVFIAKSKNADLYLKYGGGNPRLLEWFNVIARDEDKYDLSALETRLQGKQAEFIHKYLADVIAATEGEGFHKFIQKAAVYRRPVDKTAFEGIGDAEFLETGVDLTLVEREDVPNGEAVYWVTPVIRENMWSKLTVDEMSAMHKHAYQWYDGWISRATEPNYAYMEEAVHHALEVDNIPGACKHAAVLGQYFDDMVLYRSGRAFMEKVAVRVSDAVIDEAKAKKDAKVGDFLNEYGKLLWTLGDSKQAIAFHKKSLAIRLEVYGEKHPHVAQSYNNIGEALRALDKSKQAIVFHKKALDIQLEVYGKKHQDVALSYNNIGVAWHSLGKAKQAIEFYEKSLAIQLEVHGEKHPRVATSYGNIGSAWKSLGDSKQAIEFFKKALAIFLEVYGERHPNIATSYRNLAAVFRKSGNRQKASFYEAKARAAWH